MNQERMKIKTNSVNWLAAIFFLTTLVLTFGSLPAILTDPVPHYFIQSCFYLLLVVGQNVLIAGLTILILSPIFFFCRKDRAKLYWSVLPYSIVLIFFIVSSKVYSFWHLYLNRAVFELFFSKGGGTNVFEVTPVVILLIAVMVVCFFVFSYLLLMLAKRMALKKQFRLMVFLLGLIYLFAQVAYGIALHKEAVPYLQYVGKVPYFTQVSPVSGMAAMGVPITPKASLFKSLKTVLNKNDRLDYPLRPLIFTHQKKHLNVLFIVLDTLRYDSVQPELMPHLYQFAQHSDQFLDNWSGGDCTRAGIFSLFYGIPVTYWDSVLSHHQGGLLVRAFHQAGYQFGVFASAGFLSPPWNKTILLPLHHYMKITPGQTPKDRDIAITEKTVAFLKHVAKTGHPFFGFTFFDLPHAYNTFAANQPFKPSVPLNYFTVNNQTNPVPILNQYHNAVYFDDQLLEQIFVTLKQTGLEKNTVVIVTADHGQEFNEYRNNYWEHASGFSKYQIRTPLVVKWPGKRPQVIQYQTTHFDLLPTLLKRVLGVKNAASDYSVGYDLYQTNQANFVIAGHYGQYALVTNGLVMPFQKSGLFRFTDNRMTPLAVSQLPKAIRVKLMKQMWRFY